MTLREASVWLLWPLTLPYGAWVRLRAFAYRKGILPQKRLAARVISVGNLTTGGTGKTPMVLWIAQRLDAEGKSAGILTRGYGGKLLPSGSTSDEAQLLSKRLGARIALGIGADRFARGKELAERGTAWFVLDDGFQHLQLARDADVVLIDAIHPFGGGHLLPSGRLREPRSALRRATAVVITRSDHAPGLESAIRRDTEAPIFYARNQLDSIRILRGDEPGEEDARARFRRFFAFCGIGNPDSFLADLHDWGLRVVGHQFFPDHHRYIQHDLESVGAAAHAAGADGLICTEKDVFNLAGVKWRAADIWYCRISLRIGREDQFWSTVMDAAAPRGGSEK
ncbi:MAG TPA: tetraacyldisaccharide 4'-kinase [Candidatus Aquilonibacter sp.]|nr:tetraacyldisaccharide 4'-kinase [Candidatus Aquilonibacter sp.]